MAITRTDVDTLARLVSHYREEFGSGGTARLGEMLLNKLAKELATREARKAEREDEAAFIPQNARRWFPDEVEAR